MSCPRAKTSTKRVCCDDWNLTLGERQGRNLRKGMDDFKARPPEDAGFVAQHEIPFTAKLEFEISGIAWMAEHAPFCPFCGKEIKTIEEEYYPCDTGCFDTYDGDESPSIHNDIWGSQGPDCITVPREAVLKAQKEVSGGV